MLGSREQKSWSFIATLAACVLLVGCVGGHGAGQQYSLDTVSNTCLRNPANCPPVVGHSATASTTVTNGSLVGAAAAGGLLIRPSRDLEANERAAIDKVLAECADDARSEVMLKHFKDGRPTREECEEVVGTDRRGQPITRAMQLGVEQHDVALRCAAERLGRLRPGGFALTPRYRFDPKTGKTEFIPPDVVEQLLRQGRTEELRGTIEPDLVIHEGDPRRVQDTYDFKFPCMNPGKLSPWREYPDGHPYEGRNQQQVYRDALGRVPAQVQPRLGVSR